MSNEEYPRSLGFESVENARELGGWPAGEGRVVGQGKILRTAHLHDLSDEDMASLMVLGLTHVVDLRTPAEREAMLDRPMPGVENLHLSVVPDEQAEEMQRAMREAESKAQSGTAMLAAPLDDNGLYRMYVQMGSSYETMRNFMMDTYTALAKSERAHKGYARLFSILLDENTGAVLFHCAGGKDRTGVAAALILSALGAPKDIVLQDYLLTNTFYGERMRRIEQQARQAGLGEDYIKCLNVIPGVHADLLEEYLERIEAKYGSARQYVANRLGVGEEGLAKLRERYTQ